jgi:MoxR-like ATPase
MRPVLQDVIGAIGDVVLGKERVIRLSLACVLARGHLLVEDIPGIGKTTLALALAHVLGLNFGRIQCTSDLLPADITGTSVFDPREHRFDFRPGPLFHQLILADEINRATPKTQSALLEAMGEGQVTVDGRTYRLPRPFFVIATQNPVEQFGTFPLPESQLDRFFMVLRMDYPSRKAERDLLHRLDSRRRLDQLKPVLSPPLLEELQNEVLAVTASDALVDYVLDMVWATRHSERLTLGISPRGGEALVLAAKAWAYLEGRAYCLPEDVQATAPSVMAHRLLLRETSAGLRMDAVVDELLRAVPVP